VGGGLIGIVLLISPAAAAPVSASPEASVHYVALGDSVAAGEGLSRASDPDGQACHRSPRAYPTLLARRKPFVGPRSGFLNVTCSEATTADVLNRWQRAPGGRSIPPQLTRIRRARPDVITLSIGLNDLRWYSVVPACLTPTSTTPAGAQEWAERCRSQDALVQSGLRRVGTNLPKILAALRARTPRPLVLVTGYYEPWPAEADVPRCSSAHGDLGSLVYPQAVANGNVGRLRSWAAQLDTLLANQARQHGAVFVPLAGAFAGHTLCSRDEWLLYPSEENVRNLTAFHPTARGQRRIADLVVRAALAAR
jgi:lysophospholipase L1-like esterase